MLFSRRGRGEEFEAAALPYLDDICRTATRVLLDRGKADDVVQDVFLQAWKSFDRFEAGTNCRAWLFKILFHTLQHHRRKWFQMKEAGDIAETIPAYDPPVPERLTDGEILAALDAIPREFREVVLLVDVEEFSYKDAAGIVNAPVGTVMSRLSRGRRILRERLAGYAQSYGIGKDRSA